MPARQSDQRVPLARSRRILDFLRLADDAVIDQGVDLVVAVSEDARQEVAALSPSGQRRPLDDTGGIGQIDPKPGLFESADQGLWVLRYPPARAQLTVIDHLAREVRIADFC